MKLPSARFLIVSTLAIALVACGGGGSSPTAPPPTAVMTVAAEPNPAVGGPCQNCGSVPNQREVVTRLTVREIAGVGVNLAVIDLRLQLDSGEVLVNAGFDASGIVFFAGTARLAANGQLVLPNIGVHYPENRDGLAGSLTYGVRGTDDSGHPVSVSVSVRVTT